MPQFDDSHTHSWLSSTGVPLQTSRYRRKLRILAGNECTGTCWFCHNEGMPKSSSSRLDTDSLIPVLPHLGHITGYKAVISGGEPALNPQLPRLVEILFDAGFDVTVICSQVGLPVIASVLHMVSAIHFSVRLHDYGDERNPYWQQLLTLREKHEAVRVTVNTTVEVPSRIAAKLDTLLGAAELLHARLKLLGLFEGVAPARRLMPDVWIDRWRTIVDGLEERRFEFFSFDGRTVRFEHRDGQCIDLSEISCLSSGRHYSDGQCFASMDVVVDPAGELRLCRWQKNGVPLLSANSVEAITASLNRLTAEDALGCPLRADVPPLLRHPRPAARYEYEPHLQWPAVSERTASRARTLLTTSQLSFFGRESTIARFESAFARHVGAGDVLAVCSGSAALYLAYQALGFTNGAEVIVPAYSYPGTVTPLQLSGARVVFCDSEVDSGNIDVESFLRTITPATRGVVVTHMWGHPADMESLERICRERRIAIVEDCSHALTAEVQGRRVGTFGDAACYSLQANKIVFAGEGGVVAFRSRDHFEHAVALASLGERIRDSARSSAWRRYRVTGLGMKLKIHPLGAALALGSLEELQSNHDARNERVRLLSEMLEGASGITTPRAKPYATRRDYYTYKILLNTESPSFRYEIVDALCRSGIDAKLPDWELVAGTPAFGGSPLSYPNASAYTARIISLPAFTHEDPDLIRYYGETITRVLTLMRRSEPKRRASPIAALGR